MEPCLLDFLFIKLLIDIDLSHKFVFYGNNQKLSKKLVEIYKLLLLPLFHFWPNYQIFGNISL